MGGGGTTAASLHALPAHPFLAATGLYAAAVLAWVARCYQAAHHRQTAEHDWERRRVDGEQPAPLIPCCMLARRSDGAAHDSRRCTDTFHRITASLDLWSNP
ncbi:hypothetical protein ACN6LD_002431 [Streptomyces sp. SAS_272]